MRKIKIIAVPLGFAPEHIRQAWVGVEIPLPEEELSQGIAIGNEGVYVVSGNDAITALRNAGKHKAADFWEHHVLPAAQCFSKQVCELIEE